MASRPNWKGSLTLRISNPANSYATNVNKKTADHQACCSKT